MSVVEAPTTELEDPAVLTEAEQKLLNAERYMREHGWCSEKSRDKDGRVCVLGALAYGNGGLMCGICASLAYVALAKVVGRDPVIWNDAVCQSEEEAIGALRQARKLVTEVAR